MADSTRQRRASAALLLLLVTALPWQTNLGPVTDPQESPAVELAKFATAAVAVALALNARTRTPAVGRVVLGLLIAYATVSALGALMSDSVLATESAQRSVRYAVVVAATFAAARTAGPARLLRLLTGFAVVQAVLALAGGFAGVVPRYDGRLSGALPPMHPNALALILAVGFAAVLARRVAGDVTTARTVALAAVLAPPLVLSGSRTSLLAAALAFAALLVLGATLSQRLAAGWVALTGATTVLIIDTLRGGDTLGSLLTRGAQADFDLRTLTGRTEAWEVAFDTHTDATTRLLGAGLAEKTVVVPDSFIPFQVVDGTWPAAYLQAGWLGFALLTVAALLLGARALRTSRPAALLLVTLLPIAIVESQLNDVTYGLVVFTALAGGLATGRPHVLSITTPPVSLARS